MKKEEIIEFFDRLAHEWDRQQERNEEVIEKILDKGEITEGRKVLDVASGTGILFEDYLKRKVDLTAVDISPEMVKTAKEKYPEIKIICADAENYSFGESFQSVMIYNAFPHFPGPERVIENLTAHLDRGGRLTVAHGTGKAKIDECHSGAAKNISLPLPEAEELSVMMGRFLTVDTVISEENMYLVSGTKK